MRILRFLFLIAAAPVGFAANDDIPHDVSAAVICLRPEEGGFLHIRRGAPVKFRYHVGGIPHTSEDKQPYRIVTVVFYAPNGSRAVVGEGTVAGNDIVLTPSPFDEYLLRRARGHWETLDGQGGPGMYRRVADFVSALADAPLYSLSSDVKTSPASCIDESVWNTPGSEYLKAAHRSDQ